MLDAVLVKVQRILNRHLASFILCEKRKPEGSLPSHG
jgi:hypothetical protein